MKGRAALFGVFLLSIFGIFVVYQSTNGSDDRIKFVARKSFNFPSDDVRMAEDTHSNKREQSSQRRKSKINGGKKMRVTFDDDYVADTEFEKSEGVREAEENVDENSPAEEKQPEDGEVAMVHDDKHSLKFEEESHQREEEKQKKLEQEKKQEMERREQERQELAKKQQQLKEMREHQREEEKQKKLEEEKKQEMERREQERQELAKKQQQLKEMRESQLKQEAERRRQNQGTGDARWNGLDPKAIHQKYPSIELFEKYRMRRFVDLSDPTAKGMEGKPKDINDMTDSEAEERFYQLVVENHANCEPNRRMGNSGDGGWSMCVSEPYKPRPGCLVYSFGINNDWSFDDAVSSTYGCEVKAFDPSMHQGDHQHSDKVFFYNLGLFGKNFVDERSWKMETFGTILRDLGHKNRIIDYLKIDIEYSEWSSLEAMFREGSLRNVRQFGFEIHTPELNSKKTNRFEFEKMYNTLLELEKLGFRRWYHHYNHFGVYTSQRTGERRTCCYELVYININFLK